MKMRQTRIAYQKVFIYFLCLVLGSLIGGCSSNFQSEQPDVNKTIRVLFIGNSFTFTNDLPEMVKNLAESGGFDIETTSLAQGGWTLSEFAQSPETIDTLRQGNWDYVVLQEQSLLPTNSEDRDQSMYPAIRFLHSEIEELNADTILYLTWGYQDGFPQSGFNDFFEMQNPLTKGYLDIANELSITVSPVGEAWKNALHEDLTLDLWKRDGSHPSIKGSYLATCVFYAVIFQESPAGLDYLAGLEENVGLALQSIAAQTVFQNFELWNIK